MIEVYHPGLVVRLSEVFGRFQIISQDRLIYSGRGVVQSLVSTGLTQVCEVALEEGSWREVEFTPSMLADGKLREEFRGFVQEWQKLYRVRPEYKVIIADMQTFLTDLRLWLDQVELSIRIGAGRGPGAAGGGGGNGGGGAGDCGGGRAVREIRGDRRPAGGGERAGASQLHAAATASVDFERPLFAYRAFAKPLGYAGDYEMVNMMARNAQEGGSLFAKVVNAWFLRQAPAQAHRNRIEYLSEHLLMETARVAAAGRRARIQNVACGPAQEIQKFLREQPLSAQASFRLLDFNEETIQYVRSVMGGIQASSGRPTECSLSSNPSTRCSRRAGGRSSGRRGRVTTWFIARGCSTICRTRCVSG